MAGGVAAATSRDGGHGQSATPVTGAADKPASRKPVTLPPTIAGLSPVRAADDFGQNPGWKARAAAATGGMPIMGREYGSQKEHHTIRLVAARVDLTGSLELAWVADQGTAYGHVRCTQNFAIGTGAKASVRPTMMLCWRATSTFTAYALIVDIPHHPVATDGVRAVESLWAGN